MTAPTAPARQNKLPQPEPPSLAEQDSPEVGALKAALEDLHQTNEDLQHALEATRASLTSTMTEAPASLNFYGVTAKGWNIQYTIRDASDDALIARFGQVLKKMEQFNIQPKPVGQQPAAATAEAPSGTNGAGTTAAPSGNYEWKMKNGALDLFKGKMTLILHSNAAEPNEIACPQHPGKMLKRRANDDGAWLSHKQGEGFCSASFAEA